MEERLEKTESSLISDVRAGLPEDTFGPTRKEAEMEYVPGSQEILEHNIPPIIESSMPLLSEPAVYGESNLFHMQEGDEEKFVNIGEVGVPVIPLPTSIEQEDEAGLGFVLPENTSRIPEHLSFDPIIEQTIVEEPPKEMDDIMESHIQGRSPGDLMDDLMGRQEEIAAIDPLNPLGAPPMKPPQLITEPTSGRSSLFGQELDDQSKDNIEQISGIGYGRPMESEAIIEEKSLEEAQQPTPDFLADDEDENLWKAGGQIEVERKVEESPFGTGLGSIDDDLVIKKAMATAMSSQLIGAAEGNAGNDNSSKRSGSSEQKQSLAPSDLQVEEQTELAEKEKGKLLEEDREKLAKEEAEPKLELEPAIESFIPLSKLAKPVQLEEELQEGKSESRIQPLLKKKEYRISSSIKMEEKPEEPTSSEVSQGCPFQPMSDLMYWKDPKKSGIVFGIGLVILLSLSWFSIISVVAYTSLAALSSTLGFRIYKTVLGAVQKTSDGHPFQEYLDIDFQPSNKRVHEIVDVILNHYNCTVKKLRGVFLVEDIIDSLKFVVLFWFLTYIGAWFNGMTLVILAYLSVFSLPKLYEMNKAQVDQYLKLACTHIQDIVSTVKSKIPFPSGKKDKTQ